MTRRIMLLVSTLSALVVAQRAGAQTWTPAQQEVLDHIDACWAAWAISVEEWDRVCHPSAQAVYWWATDGAPQPIAEHKRTYVKPAHTNFTARRPIAVQLEGDFAIVHFYAMYDF